MSGIVVEIRGLGSISDSEISEVWQNRTPKIEDISPNTGWEFSTLQIKKMLRLLNYTAFLIYLNSWIL